MLGKNRNRLKKGVKMDKKRNFKYEHNFRKYLFSFDLEKHKEICRNINVKHNQQIKCLCEVALKVMEYNGR